MRGPSNQAPLVWRLIAGWKRSAAEAYALDPISTVAEFERLWHWLLVNLLLSETRHAAAVLRAEIEVSNN